jgi:Glycosyl transferases group 1
MRAHITPRAHAPTVYVDSAPLAEPVLSGIGRYTAQLSLALAAHGTNVRFFVGDRELLPAAEFEWSQDQDLTRWANLAWPGGHFVPLAAIPDDAVGLWTSIRPCERTFPIELNVLRDLAPVIIPAAHEPQTCTQFQHFIAKSLLSSDGVVAISHSTKADAGWLSEFPQDRIVVAYPGPGQCLYRHLHAPQVTRRSNVGLMVTGLQPKESAGFAIDWFRSTDVLPENAELWWINRAGWHTSSHLADELQCGGGHRRIRLLGCVSDQQLCELYQSAGWSIYPSLYEGFGFPVLDALRHGMPVLSSCNSSLREFMYSGVYFFDPLDSATLDRAWTQSQSTGTKLVTPAQLDEDFNWDHVARTILRFAGEFRPPARSSARARSAQLSELES